MFPVFIPFRETKPPRTRSGAMEPAAAPNTNWLQTINDPKNANLDVVAVHGMNVSGSDDHSANTWTEEQSNINWLKDFLPETLPRARILAYQYNANVVFRASVAGIREQALNLLQCLHLKRSSHREIRPIIFIAHSMGGILVKEAVATAFQDSQLYPMLWIFTYGIIFFGVPHKGFKQAAWGETATRIVQLFTGRPNRNFLSSVEEGSSYNIDLSDRFSPLINAFKFFNICETVPEQCGIDVGLIVEPDSASLDLPDSQEVKLYSNRTHRTICKFARRSEPEWTQIAEILVRGAACAVHFTGYSEDMTTRNMTMVHSDEMPKAPYAIQHAVHQDVAHYHAVHQALITLHDSVRLQAELRSQEKKARGEAQGLVFWVQSILAMFNFAPVTTAFSFLETLFPRANAIIERTDLMERVDRAWQDQQALIEFQKQAIKRLDSNRDRLLKATVWLQLPFAHGKLPPPELLAERSQLLLQLSQQIKSTINDMKSRHRAIPEERRRLRRIEDDQREAQSMDDRQVLELLGRYA